MTDRRQLVALLNLSAEFLCEQDFHAAEPALRLLEESSPPDLILMDIGLPGISGIEGVRCVKALAPAVQVVILTVFDDNDNVLQAIAAGASGYLHKLFTQYRALSLPAIFFSITLFERMPIL